MKMTINENEFELIVGDITKQHTDAIVNAANGTLLGGGGVDGAIHQAAGKELLEACRKVRADDLDGAYLPTGDVVLTKGYNLPAAHVIHTVGPVWNNNTTNNEELLADCYRHALDLAMEKELKSISFPSISTGVYRFPVELAAKVATGTIIDFLSRHSFGLVRMTLFSEADYKVYKQEMEKQRRN
ncbi:O-acetyl-ADP-ribose deacetylase [Virgibacillus sp. NKC19-3]|uniref:O-acetyl-ADP-ribose deacetylase n=1 Tax=Virgibacillus saliphilus TaxID=2831674 RepID=UPI001C9AF20C|nr:O-acetyl-ADP-ribose deacetylase [Virgibacillus sp. NKC19-3]MBY7145030.1 O-acetyl-ADP-ribose deacetylase [Virgibacillus sp. NKC19-3]